MRIASGAQCLSASAFGEEPEASRLRANEHLPPAKTEYHLKVCLGEHELLHGEKPITTQD